MKVILVGGKEFSVSGIFSISDTQICVSFTSITSYDELRQSLTSGSLREIKYYSVDNSESFETYEDYITFVKASAVETDNGITDVAVYLEKANEITKLKEQVTTLQDTLDALVIASLEE